MMDREEKELNEILDRLLAGEKIDLGVGISDELRKKVLTAEKLLACTSEPNPLYQQNLKRLALNLLASQQAPTGVKSSGWRQRLTKLLAAPAVWRTAAVAATVGALTLVVIWAAGLMHFQREKPPVVGVPPAIIGIEPVTSGMLFFPLGSEVRVELLLRNTGTNEAIIKPFPPEIWVNNPMERLPLRTLPAGNSEVEVAPSGDVTFTLTWDQRDGSGQPVPPGMYTVSVVNITVYQGDTAEPTVSDALSVAQIEIISP